MWLDDCRIPFVDETDKGSACNKNHEQGKYDTDFFEGYFKRKGSDTKGRFTPNLLVCDDMLNDGSVSKSGSNRKNKEYKPLPTVLVKMGGGDKNYEPNDSGSSSRYYDLDKWFDKVIGQL